MNGEVVCEISRKFIGIMREIYYFVDRDNSINS